MGICVYRNGAMSTPQRIQAMMLLMTALASTVMGQQGDRSGEEQPPLPDSLDIPASPPLSPAQAMASFTLPEGLSLELIAAEPLVIAPVTSTFGPDGRLWVVEMPGYMSDIDGSSELEPTGRIVLLSDTDQDGTMDTRQVYLDGLVLPRALAIVEDGLLLVAPPNLILARDLDGDDQADETTILDTSFGGLDSPEHAGNGLRYGLDNWLHCSQHSWEYRFQDGMLQRRAVPSHGQWGLTSDAWGQWYYTPNSYPLMVDLLPKHVVAMNPAQRDHAGLYQRLPADQQVHSVRINPGVNRAYRRETLNEDYTLRHFTAACSPAIYLDDVLGESYAGDVFICEPAGNTVEHRNLVDRGHLTPELRSDPEVGAILASTDERFRPVHAQTGPDGCLYITDMYRGILQHKIFMTSFLREQVEERELDSPVDRGRIWRIRPDDDTIRIPPDLTVLQDSQLVDKLIDTNGTTRLLAQQLLVERAALTPEATNRLRELAVSTGEPLGRTHALWTLQGRSELTTDLLLKAMISADDRLRSQAYHIASGHLDNSQVTAALLKGLKDNSISARRHAASALAGAEASEHLDAFAEAMDAHPGDKILRTAIVAGARGDELALLSELIWKENWIEQERSRVLLAKSLARTSLRQKDPEARLAMLELLAAIPEDQDWLALAISEEVVSVHGLRTANPRTLELPAEPFDWKARLQDVPDLAGGLLRLIDTHSMWPGRPGYEPDIDLAGLTPEEAAQLKHGAMLYTHCSGCHQPNGLGLRGFYPPLADSPFVLGKTEPLISILLKGMEGPLEVDGAMYNQPMPPAPFENDDDIAAITSFIRRSFDNQASLISPEEVSKVRKRLMNHQGPMTTQSLTDLWQSP